jgi:hypothetical protein
MRRGAKGLDPMYMREAPLAQAENTGLLAAIQDTGNGKAA